MRTTLPHDTQPVAGRREARLSLARWLAAFACVGVTVAALMIACTTPPIGYEGSGRMQGLPAIQVDAGGISDDAGVDAGMDSGVDSGVDTGTTSSSSSSSTHSSSSESSSTESSSSDGGTDG